jgi:hypothetical protein
MSLPRNQPCRPNVSALRRQLATGGRQPARAQGMEFLGRVAYGQVSAYADTERTNLNRVSTTVDTWRNATQPRNSFRRYPRADRAILHARARLESREEPAP